ncbi:MAG: T9SS C-terminal target domain-containing protein, partial [Calditrichaeota bacterium]
IVHNIDFLEIGREYIHNDRYYYLSDNSASAELRHENNHPDAVDIYFISPNSSYYSAQKVPSDNFILGGKDLGSSIISHEMGHCLGLYHTHRGSGCAETGDDICAELPDGSNCSECGDLVCDTPADPCLRYHVNSDCQYTGPPEYNPDVHNIMSYAPPNCLLFFTIGQIDRIFYMMENNEMVNGFLESYKIAVTVDQKNSANVSVGNIKHWENNWQSYAVPHTFNWDYKSTEIIKADTSLQNGEKFKYFQNNGYIIKENFLITNSDSIISQFLPVSPVKLKIKNISGATGASVHFKDPWLRDSLVNPYGMQNRGNEAIFHQYDSTLVLSLDSEHQGVFLEQGYSQGDWFPPYYEVKAEAQQTFTAHGQNINSYFLGWEGTQVDFEHPDQLETAVVFKAENAEARAVYKGHLASNIARTTGYNNGRRLCKTNDGKLHLVYEDDKSIWYTYSEDNGASWQKEICIARKDLNGNFFFIAPSIAHFDNKVYVTYIEIYTNGGYGDILINSIDYDDVNPQWSSEYWVGSIWHDDTLAVTSVVVSKTDDASGQIIPIIAVGYNFDGTNTIDIYQKELQSYYYDLVTSFEGKFPSLSADTYHSIQNEQLAIAYSFANQIFVKTAWWNSGFLTWSGYEKISEDDENYPIQTQPSLSMMNGYCHVAWLAFNDNTQKFEIFYRMYMPGTGNTISSAAPPGSLVPYGTITKIISTNYDVLDPTISALEDQTAYIFYHKNNWIYKRKFINQVHKNNWYYGEGNFPSMADHYDEGTAWKYYDTSPFLIHTDANGPSNAIPITPVNPNWGSINKVLNANQNGGSSGRITINFFDFTYGVDTLSFNQTLRTDNLAVNGNLVKFSMDLQVIFNNVQNLPPNEEALYYAYFVDQNDTIFLSKLTYGDLPKNAGPDGERFFKVNTIVDLGNRNGNFYIDLADTTFIVYRNLIENEENTIGKFKIERQILPESFALHQNFPNPFNPVTHITVDLPQDAKVELSVFDINGKKVQTLLTGQKPAGIYEVIFDGKHLASGVYIYRLTTNKGFVQSRKMMLIK